MQKYDKENIKVQLIERVEQVVKYLLPMGNHQSNEWCAGNTGGDPGKSLKAHLSGSKAGLWSDFATGESGDIIELWMTVRSVDFAGALKEASEWLGLSNALPKSRKQSNRPRVYNIVPPTPNGTKRHIYADENGDAMNYVDRIERTDGSKSFCQWGPGPDGEGWVKSLKNMKGKRIPYRLPSIVATEKEVVFFHEGEECVDVALSAGLSGVHTTTLGGALAAQHTDFSTFSGRDVVIVPDNDSSGEAYAEIVADLLHEAGAGRIRFLRLLGLPPKGDIVEWLEDGGDAGTWVRHLEAHGEDYDGPKPSGDSALEQSKQGDGDSGSDAKRLVKLVQGNADLFHNPAGEAFAIIAENGHNETWALESSGFRDWLCRKAFIDCQMTPTEFAIRTCINALSGIAKYDGPELEVHLRLAPYLAGYMLDLCDEDWRAVHITPEKVELVSHPEVRFVRSKNAMALPEPEDGTLDDIWEFVNIPERERPLFLAFLLECFRPDTPYILLQLTGEQGSAKSCTHRVIRRLIDPCRVAFNSAPKAVQDLFVSAKHNHLVSLENISNLSDKLQDAFCVLCTGGGFSARKLYTDSDESVIDVKRPVVINGISNSVLRPDLIDRTISFDLPKVTEYKEESTFWSDFERALPRILGALLGLFSRTLAQLPNTVPEGKIRMVDFVKLGEAMQKALGQDDPFVDVYTYNKKEALAQAVESSPSAAAVLGMMGTTGNWTGTVKQLLEKVTPSGPTPEGWPKSERGFSGVLRRMGPALRELGVSIEWDERSRVGKILHLESSVPRSELQNDRHDDHGELPF